MSFPQVIWVWLLSNFPLTCRLCLTPRAWRGGQSRSGRELNVNLIWCVISNLVMTVSSGRMSVWLSSNEPHTWRTYWNRSWHDLRRLHLKLEDTTRTSCTIFDFPQLLFGEVFITIRLSLQPLLESFLVLPIPELELRTDFRGMRLN